VSIGARIFAAMYDGVMKQAEAAGLSAMRQELLAGAHGDVLEVGAGTGANLAMYGTYVASLTLAEPEEPMRRRLHPRVDQIMPQAVVVPAAAEDLPFSDGAFDTVVSTLVLCTTRDEAQSLREIRRVLRPGGQLLFIEHVRADEPRLARRQDRLNRLHRIVAHGCNCNRPTLTMLRAAGFDVTKVEHGGLQKAPSWMRPLIIGTATAP
jgi:ubiquinone/menaquinone biosynthesis C-methylase UbiE